MSECSGECGISATSWKVHCDHIKSSGAMRVGIWEAAHVHHERALQMGDISHYSAPYMIPTTLMLQRFHHLCMRRLPTLTLSTVCSGGVHRTSTGRQAVHTASNLTSSSNGVNMHQLVTITSELGVHPLWRQDMCNTVWSGRRGYRMCRSVGFACVWALLRYWGV